MSNPQFQRRGAIYKKARDCDHCMCVTSRKLCHALLIKVIKVFGVKTIARPKWIVDLWYCGSLIYNYACLVRYDEFTAPIRCLSIQTIFANVVYVTTVPFDRVFDIYSHNLFEMGVCDVWLWCFYCMKSTLYSLDTIFWIFVCFPFCFPLFLNVYKTSNNLVCDVDVLVTWLLTLPIIP